MRTKQSRKSAWILALLMLGAFTLVFQLGAIGALAQDADYDGFSDTLEGNGFTLTPGMSLAAYPNVTSLPNCAQTPPNTPRDKCLDPATQDFFVIIKRATAPCPASPSCGDPCGQPLFGTSDIAMPSEYQSIYGNPLGPLQWVSGIKSGFTIHEILQTSGTSQIVTPGGWYSVRIVEDLNPCSSWMGLSTPGVPTGTSSATVWPEKIMNWIDKACSQACFTNAKTGATTCYYVPGFPAPAGYLPAPGTFVCKNANNSAYLVDMKAAQPNLAPLYNDFIKNVISHEASHMMHLAFGPGTSADNHWPIAQGVLMEQFIATKVTKDRNNNIVVTLYISTGYTNQDKTQYGLR